MIVRGFYGQINYAAIPRPIQQKIKKLVIGAGKAGHIDEHGAWEFGARFDKKGRGAAINWAVYGYGLDIHTRKFLAVVQLRKWEKRTKNGWVSTQKSYFLLGRNEDRSIFAHPVESRVIHHVIKTEAGKVDPGAIVRAVQGWIFKTDYRRVLRQGDVALVPIRAAKIRAGRSAEEIGADDLPLLLQGSHVLQGACALRTPAGLLAYSPALRHLPGVHPDVAGKGWHRVMVGARAEFHSFAAPTID